jgi:hypothetical protein
MVANPLSSIGSGTFSTHCSFGGGIGGRQIEFIFHQGIDRDIKETISVEMAIGQLIQHVVRLHTGHETQVRMVTQLRSEVERLAASAPSPASSPPARKKRSPSR